MGEFERVGTTGADKGESDYGSRRFERLREGEKRNSIRYEILRDLKQKPHSNWFRFVRTMEIESHGVKME